MGAGSLVCQCHMPSMPDCRSCPPRGNHTQTCVDAKRGCHSPTSTRTHPPQQQQQHPIAIATDRQLSADAHPQVRHTRNSATRNTQNTNNPRKKQLTVLLRDRRVSERGRTQTDRSVLSRTHARTNCCATFTPCWHVRALGAGRLEPSRNGGRVVPARETAC